MRRRQFISLLGGAAAWPRGVLAQATNRRTMIAWLWAGSQSVADEYVRAGKLLPPFLKGMQEFGYTEGRDFDMVYRFACGRIGGAPSKRLYRTGNCPGGCGQEGSYDNSHRCSRARRSGWAGPCSKRGSAGRQSDGNSSLCEGAASKAARACQRDRPRRDTDRITGRSD